MKKINTIIILGSGKSTRFWPLRDKTTFKFLGKSLLAHQIDKLKAYSDTFFVSANESNKTEIEEIASGYSDLSITVFTHDMPGQAQAILAVGHKISGTTLVVNVNDFFDGDLISGILERVESDDSVESWIATQKMDEYFPGGYVEMSGERVVGIVEKPPVDRLPSNIVRLAVDYFKDGRKFVDIIGETQGDESERYEVALSAFVKKYTVRTVECAYTWYCLKYPWHTLSLLEYFLSRVKDSRASSAAISPTAALSGQICIGDNVTIGDFVKIVGPCYIGDNSIIGDYALVRQSYIGQNSVIGGYSEVARSYIGDSVYLHRNYVGDSVLDRDVLMGSGTTCANFRFDGSRIASRSEGEKIDTGRVKLGAMIGCGAKIGVNSTLLPGIKVGLGTYIGPAETVRDDIEDNKFVSGGEVRDKK